MSDSELRKLRWFVVGVGTLVLLVVGLCLSLMTYPFKTVEFTGNPPIKIMNEGKRVPIGGIVLMQIAYTKHINNSATILRTLIRRNTIGEMEVLDSSTMVTRRPAGSGIANAKFLLTYTPAFASERASIVFTINYTLFRVIPIQVQYESEPFEIYTPAGAPAPCPTGNLLKYLRQARSG